MNCSVFKIFDLPEENILFTYILQLVPYVGLAQRNAFMEFNVRSMNV